MIASLLPGRIGSLPLIGVNTFLPEGHVGEVATKIKLIRSTPEEKREQIDDMHAFQQARNQFASSGEVDRASKVDFADESTSVRAERSPKGVVEAQRAGDGHDLEYFRTPPASARTCLRR